MKVTLVLPDIRTTVAGYSGAFSHAVAYLSRYLKNAGHSVDLLQITRAPSKREFQVEIERRNADVLGFSSIYHFFPLVRQWADWSKEVSSAPIVVGGVHATLSPDDVISHPSIDMLCRGEGERAFPELCEALARGVRPVGIENIWYKENGVIVRNEMRPLVRDLDKLDFPDYSIHDYKELFFSRTNVLSVMISRGCPYGCHYCLSRALTEVYSGRGHFYRFLSPERAAELLVFLKRSYPNTGSFVFNDSILFPNKSWLEKFVALYKRGVGLPFVANCRPEMIDRDVALMLREMNCRIVCFGLESGNEQINRLILGRGMTKEVIRRAFDEVHRCGIRTVCYSILGSPFETRGTLLETVKFVASLRPEIATPFIFYPFPGTRAYEISKTFGFLSDRHFLNNDDGVMIEQPGVTEREVLFFHAYYKRLVWAYGLLYRLGGPLRVFIVRVLDGLLLAHYLPLRPLLVLKRFLRNARWRVQLARGKQSAAKI